MEKKRFNLGLDFLQNEITPRYIQKKLRICREEAEKKAYIYNIMNRDKQSIK